MLQRTGAVAPPNTIAGLFQSGVLDLADEVALEDLRLMVSGFGRWVNPTHGWMSPRYGDTKPAVPREIADKARWARYTAWRGRWSFLAVPPSPEFPWGLTAAGLVVRLATEPVSFDDAAQLMGCHVRAATSLFVRAVRDYGSDALVRSKYRLPVPVERKKRKRMARSVSE